GRSAGGCRTGSIESSVGEGGVALTALGVGGDGSVSPAVIPALSAVAVGRKTRTCRAGTTGSGGTAGGASTEDAGVSTKAGFDGFTTRTAGASLRTSRSEGSRANGASTAGVGTTCPEGGRAKGGSSTKSAGTPCSGGGRANGGSSTTGACTTCS